MPWPQPTDYNAAIQNPSFCFSDADLRQGTAAGDPILGVPTPRSGNFAAVYQMFCSGGQTWAVKCFTREVRGLQERYHAISSHLEKEQRAFMVDFRYLQEGIRIKGGWYPILKMRWVEGFTLNEFVAQHLDKPTILERLATMWIRLAQELREAGMAHGDLQHGNVMLVPGSKNASLALRLIDYDGLFVPALADRPSGEVGHPNFQHPQRLREGDYNAEVDRFSHLVIYTALRGVALRGKALWDRHDSSENMLFREEDFRKPAGSKLLRELWALDNPAAHALVGHLLLAAQRPLADVPLLDDIVDKGQVKPLTGKEEDQIRNLLKPEADKPRRSGLGTAAAEVPPPARTPPNLPPLPGMRAPSSVVLPPLPGTLVGAGKDQPPATVLPSWVASHPVPAIPMTAFPEAIPAGNGPFPQAIPLGPLPPEATMLSVLPVLEARELPVLEEVQPLPAPKEVRPPTIDDVLDSMSRKLEGVLPVALPPLPPPLEKKKVSEVPYGQEEGEPDGAVSPLRKGILTGLGVVLGGTLLAVLWWLGWSTGKTTTPPVKPHRPEPQLIGTLQEITLNGGEQAPLGLQINRDRSEAPLTLKLDDLPVGVEVVGERELPAPQAAIQLQLKADPDAKSGPAVVRISLWQDGRETHKRYFSLIVAKRVRPNLRRPEAFLFRVDEQRALDFPIERRGCLEPLSLKIEGLNPAFWEQLAVPEASKDFLRLQLRSRPGAMPEVKDVKLVLSMGDKEVDRQPLQVRLVTMDLPSLEVPALAYLPVGGTKTLPIVIRRRGYEGEVEVEAVDLPQGVTSQLERVPANTKEVYLKLRAAEQARTGTFSLKVVCRIDGGQTAAHRLVLFLSSGAP